MSMEPREILARMSLLYVSQFNPAFFRECCPSGIDADEDEQDNAMADAQLAALEAAGYVIVLTESRTDG